MSDGSITERLEPIFPSADFVQLVSEELIRLHSYLETNESIEAVTWAKKRIEIVHESLFCFRVVVRE